jgi:hypothetical protein
MPPLPLAFFTDREIGSACKVEGRSPSPVCPAHHNSGKESSMPKESLPAAKFRLGYVTATVWKNGDFYSTVLSRSYKDGEDWKDTDQLSSGDLMNAVRVLQRAEDYISRQ